MSKTSFQASLWIAGGLFGAAAWAFGGIAILLVRHTITFAKLFT